MQTSSAVNAGNISLAATGNINAAQLINNNFSTGTITLAAAIILISTLT